MARCNIQECPIARNGRCLEGRADDCPNLLPDTPSDTSSPVSDATAAMPPQNDAAKEFESLHAGIPLNVIEARRFASRGRAVVVGLVGMLDCGKTSLIARFHQLFQAGPIGVFNFAGSQTLPRFEELNWKATVESGQSSPSMDRTSTQFDNSFLHFRVRRKSSERSIDILINDVSGETYRDAVASQAKCETLSAIQRADHIALLLDGAVLSLPSTRHGHVSKAKDFLQRLLQSGQIGKQTALHLVINKLDELKGHGELITSIETEFLYLYATSVGSFKTWRIAVRPSDETFPTNDVIAAMFSDWLTTSYQYPSMEVPPLARGTIARDFCRFGL
jgi:hypothetical protein